MKQNSKKRYIILYKLLNGDCLDLMNSIPDQSIDAIIGDPPYGTLDLEWDNIIPFELMWKQFNRIIKPNGAIVLFGSQPFTTKLIASNIKQFKHEIIWFKNVPTGMAQASYAPMKYHENILVFCDGKVGTFNKQLEQREGKGKDCYNYAHYCGETNHVKMEKVKKFYDAELVNPSSIVLFNTEPNRKGKVHPTQKPVKLMEYLIKTYTNEGNTVLDPFMGSGSTGVACVNTDRDFIGIELKQDYFDIASSRIKESSIPSPTLF